MAFEQYITPKKAFVFSLDNVLYPEKDYLLQVYYLFSEFMEYTAQLNAKEMIAFMQQEYETFGATSIFEKTATKFDIPLKYAANFNLLHQNAILPLKLLLYNQVLAFLQEVVVERKDVFLWVEGDPVQQLNKIRQLEWNGLEKYLKVYFAAELEITEPGKGLEFMLATHGLSKESVLMIGAANKTQEYASLVGVEYLIVTKLL